MATKLNDTCLAKAADNEPIFVLRAQDLTAPILVVLWILCQLLFGVVEFLRWDQGTIAQEKSLRCSDERLQEAFKQALEMRRWPKRKLAD